MSENNLVDIQTDAAGRATADSYFSDITIITDRVKDIATEINKGLGLVKAKGGKVGACVLVKQVVASDEAANAPGGPMNVELEFLVMENPVLNLGASGTQKHCLAIARRLHRIFKHYYAHGHHTPLMPMRPCIVPTVVDIAPVAYSVRFQTRESDIRNTEYVKVAMPLIAPNTGEGGTVVTLSCTTDAQIYYTLDGTHPRSGNGVLYAAPITIPLAGATLKAVAYKAGYIASDLNQAIYTAGDGVGWTADRADITADSIEETADNI